MDMNPTHDDELRRYSAKRIGRLARDARMSSGLSRELAAARSDRFSSDSLHAIERGHRKADAEDLAALAELYGIDPLSLAPRRAAGFGDLGDLWLAGAAGGIDVREALAAYLAALHGMRQTQPTTVFELRDQDLATLRSRLGLSERRLLDELRALVAGSDDRAAGPAGAVGSPTSTELVVHTPAPMLLDRPRAAELEQIYDELYTAPPRLIGKRQHAERCAELRERQRHLLEEVGCDNWIDYMLRISATPTQVF